MPTPPTLVTTDKTKPDIPAFKSELVEGVSVAGIDDPLLQRLLQAHHVLKTSGMISLQPILPLLLSIKGEPYTLANYFPFEPFFRTRMARRTLFKTGRQVSKSTSLGARGIVHSNCVPWFSTLYVAPLFETIRRFSQNYVRPFIETSPIRGLFSGADTVNSVLQRTFRNNSKMLFSFAFLDAERTRGISADKNSFDEIQSMDKSFIPIILETMSGSKYGGIEEYAGTPLGLDNTIEDLWQDSSQAEWVIRCHRGICGHWNVPALSHDLDRMTGPLRNDIAIDKPAVICAKCGRWIDPRFGRWVHGLPDRRWSFAGYHVPQMIMPMHYGNREKWATLLGKRQGRGNTSINVYYNEVCGESYDSGSRIVTISELRAAADLPWANKIEEAAPHIDEYVLRVLGVDWGGGGVDEMSFTKMAVVGMLASGELHVLWGLKSMSPHEHEHEARLCLAAISKFQCHAFAHDYTGAGSLRETFINQAGMPMDKIIPVSYLRAAATARIMTYKPATKMNPRSYYQVDKARSLLLVCNQIKNKRLRFFRWDYESADDPGLIYDFLALVDEKVDSRLGKDIFTITRDKSRSDDFAHAVNIACCSLWHMSDKWPDISAVAHMRLSPHLIEQTHPPRILNLRDWEKS